MAKVEVTFDDGSSLTWNVEGPVAHATASLNDALYGKGVKNERTGTYRVYFRYAKNTHFTGILENAATGSYSKCQAYVDRVRPTLSGFLTVADYEIRPHYGKDRW